MTRPDSAERQALAELGLGDSRPLPVPHSDLVPEATPVETPPGARPFSWGWALASALVFGAFQLTFGWAASTWIFKGQFLTENMRFFVEGSINLVSYFLSGFLIGVVSPRVRILEPAVGAALVVVATLSVGLFTPSRFLSMGPLKLLIGGALAFGMALWGAILGERITRQL